MFLCWSPAGVPRMMKSGWCVWSVEPTPPTSPHTTRLMSTVCCVHTAAAAPEPTLHTWSSENMILAVLHWYSLLYTDTDCFFICSPLVKVLFIVFVVSLLIIVVLIWFYSLSIVFVYCCCTLLFMFVVVFSHHVPQSKDKVVSLHRLPPPWWDLQFVFRLMNRP